MRLWRWWVAFTSRKTDARPLAIVRVALPAILLVDLLRVAQIGNVLHYYRPYVAGGVNVQQDDMFILDDLLGNDWGGPVAWLVTVLCMPLISLGVATRPALLIGAFFYGQTGHCYPAGDRAIDRLVRTIFLILLFSGAHRRFALGAKRVATRINAWPEDLIKWILVMMYTSAGVSKLMQQPRWLSTEGVPVLYRIMTDPMAAWLDPVIAQPFYPLFRVGGWATIALECVAVLLMTRLGRYWAILGAGMHLGIATFMNLGMFSWAMLALYPVLFAPWLCRALDARAASRG